MRFKTKIKGIRRIGELLAAVALTLALLVCISPPLSSADEASSAALCAAEQKMLIPGGMTFGVRFFTDGVLVVGFAEKGDCPAYAAGLRIGDVVLKVDGKQLGGAEELTDAIEKSGGREMELYCRRDKADFTVKITPRADENGKYKAGMWVRDGGAGIGTVTYIDPTTGAFGGLGHGICDADTGKPLPLGRGVVLGVNISGITKGSVGAPGEIKGYFESSKLGSVIKNTDCGVFGIYSEIPKTAYGAMPIASATEVKEGAATILCTLDSGQMHEYSVELYAIDKSASGGRCFSVRVTDADLLAITGGIVQGMSGSPIIQNGKLVGAVTHVLINDPTAGYGIFIENMLARE
ncbi:MAG: SpoIVB peptidase [Clostridia bacterium]|nr:SpoIVB peptidase [Clostridia bacterium]